MHPVKRLDGSTSYHLLDFKISATVIQDQAVIAEVADTGAGSLTDATTTSLLDFVGSVAGASPYNPHGGGAGTLTYSATQSDTEGLVRVYVTPDIIYRLLMAGSATAGAALGLVTATAANAAGTTITNTSSPAADMDDGIVWGLSGANVGVARRVTTYTASTSIVVTVPFPRAIAVDNTFAVIPYCPLVTTAIQLTSDFTGADASIAFGTGGNARVVELVLNGRSDSYVHMIARDHAFNELS